MTLTVKYYSTPEASPLKQVSQQLQISTHMDRQVYCLIQMLGGDHFIELVTAVRFLNSRCLYPSSLALR